MDVCQQRTGFDSPSLIGIEGELLTIRVSVPWKELEELLEALSAAPFPINPEIRHASPLTVVEFPAYSGQLTTIQNALRGAGLDCRVEAGALWTELTAH